MCDSKFHDRCYFFSLYLFFISSIPISYFYCKCCFLILGKDVVYFLIMGLCVSTCYTRYRYRYLVQRATELYSTRYRYRYLVQNVTDLNPTRYRYRYLVQPVTDLNSTRYLYRNLVCWTALCDSYTRYRYRYLV